MMFCNDTKVHLNRHKAWIIFILNVTFSCPLEWRTPFVYLLSSPTENLGRPGSTWCCDKNKAPSINGTRSKSNLMVLIHVIDANNSKSCSSWVRKIKKKERVLASTSWLHDSNLVILDVKVCQMHIPGNTSSPSLNHTGCVLIKLYFWSVSSLNPTRLFLIFSPTHAFETNYPEAASRAFFLLPLPYPPFSFFEGGRKRVIVMFVIFQSLTICPVSWQCLKISRRPMFISVISGLCLLFFFSFSP